MTLPRILGDVFRSSNRHLRGHASPPLSRAVRRASLAAAAWLACLDAGAVRGNDDLATNALNVLREHCSQCHGPGSKSEGRMDYVLDPVELEETGKIVAGKPKESFLLERIKRGEMPPQGPGPDEPQRALLHDWIAAMPPAPASQTTRDVVEAIAKHLQTLPDQDRRFQRYFTLINYPTCQGLLRARAALSKLVNSLSLESVIYRPSVQQAVVAIDLRKLGWNRGELWQEVLNKYPYGLRHKFPDDQTTQELYGKVVKQTGTDVPFVRADWFIATASRPPLYHILLRIPETAAELEERLGVDVKTNFRDDNLVRAGLRKSKVSKQNRVIERHASQHGAYWLSYDFRDTGEKADLLRSPLGPFFERDEFREFAFEHAGGEIIFHLPNGLQGYMLVNGKGNRINEAPIEVVSDSDSTCGTPQICTGLACMSCHAKGLRDDFSEIEEGWSEVRNDKALDKVRNLYRLDDLRESLTIDNAMFCGALKDAIAPEEAERTDICAHRTDTGAKPTDICANKPGGLEPIGAIARAYQEELGLTKVATELDLDSRTLQQFIGSNDTLKNLGVGSLLDGGNITREKWVRAFPEVAQALRLGDPVRFDRETPDACRRELAVGCPARIVSPGADIADIHASCTSAITNTVNVGQTVTVIQECSRGDRFCIRAEDGNVLGCARRAQLEPPDRANEQSSP